MLSVILSCRSRPLARPAQPPSSPLERLPVDAEEPRRGADVPTARVERVSDDRSLGKAKFRAARRRVEDRLRERFERRTIDMTGATTTARSVGEQRAELIERRATKALDRQREKSVEPNGSEMREMFGHEGNLTTVLIVSRAPLLGGVMPQIALIETRCCM